MKAAPTLACLDDRRRHRVRPAKDWNGLDYLEVGHDQRELIIFFLDKAPESLENLRPENISIRPCGLGREVKVERWRVCRLDDDQRDDCLHIWVDRPGGFSPYKLCLVEVDEHGCPTGKPLAGLDPRYSCLEFSFKVACPSDLDCKAERVCPPEPRVEPEINYLAKDYASFRQLILDRLALTMPEWKERHVPDLGIALVEVLAYVGDHLSYYQDAVATEAYLDTARRRISVRRHVRLVDYPMHDGCNARTWVYVGTDADLTLPPASFYCITGFKSAPPSSKPLVKDDLANVPGRLYEVFEPVAGDPVLAVELYVAHNEIRLYTWGDRECCLPRGATRATLKDEWREDEKAKEGKEQPEYGHGCEPPPPPPDPKRRLELRTGSLVLFEEVLGPKTGDPADADPAHRYVVRLTRVERSVDELYNEPVLEIEWAREDALPFPLCISAVGGEECKLLEPVSVARGNVFLADHGRRVFEGVGSVPLGKSAIHCEGEGRRSEVPQVPGRFNSPLTEAPITFRQPVPARTHRFPASRLLIQDPRRAIPAVDLSLQEPFAGSDWRVQRDLLASGPDDSHFVAEVDDDGRAHLRFGDDEMGEAPAAGTKFWVRYRVGNGPAGNIGAEAIRHLVLRDLKLSGGASLKPRNPLAACGGTAPEPVADVRLRAPCAFREELQRAITADDYARLIERDFAGRVQRAAAVLRWTGSWTEVLVVVDPLSTEEDVDRLLQEIRAALQRYRRIGHGVVVKRAMPVPLKVDLLVCVLPHFLRGHVEAALLEALGTRVLPDGRRGFFHADNLTFGQGVALSRLLAAAQVVAGVESVEARTFERLFEGPNGEIERGFLPLGPLEIARLDNALQFPDNGRLRLTMRGGR
jgi:hypothetical protein